ncbi:FKBP-type peptidyl-prolyl cis-trans isomerase [Mycobacterium sp. SMC-4]|uniref:FKBP-type peptidyl-prolyl cis-trans isomerase n=1 Tax=Mycobacterium sp. SMC-4 TaxID=2857059 RepID=UPI003CFEA4E8
MRTPVTLLASGTAIVLALTACGSDGDAPATPSPSTSSQADAWLPPVPETADETGNCPMVAAPGDAEPEWTLTGATGSVAVTGPTDQAGPAIDIQAPFSVTETQVETLQPGDGPVIADTATVMVCYTGVNGRDGSVFDSTYEVGTPVDFPLDGVIAGFRKAIAGQQVGSSVAVAMAPEDGYPQGQPAAGIQPGDTLVFAIRILAASS